MQPLSAPAQLTVLVTFCATPIAAYTAFPDPLHVQSPAPSRFDVNGLLRFMFDTSFKTGEGLEAADSSAMTLDGVLPVNFWQSPLPQQNVTHWH